VDNIRGSPFFDKTSESALTEISFLVFLVSCSGSVGTRKKQSGMICLRDLSSQTWWLCCTAKLPAAQMRSSASACVRESWGAIGSERFLCMAGIGTSSRPQHAVSTHLPHWNYSCRLRRGLCCIHTRSRGTCVSLFLSLIGLRESEKRERELRAASLGMWLPHAPRCVYVIHRTRVCV
jgi:hypothetical protein